MNILYLYYDSVATFFKIPIGVYGFVFTFWDIMLFCVFCPLIFRFVNRLLDLWGD